jgi:hypothetical protein
VVRSCTLSGALPAGTERFSINGKRLRPGATDYRGIVMVRTAPRHP